MPAHPQSDEIRRLADDLDAYHYGHHDDMERAVGVELVAIGNEIRNTDPDEGMDLDGPSPPSWVCVIMAGVVIMVMGFYVFLMLSTM